MLSRDQKKQFIDKLKNHLDNDRIIILTNYQGLSVEEITELRNLLRHESTEYKVIKNTLFLIALKNYGLDFDKSIIERQPIAIASSSVDEIAPAKIIKQFTKNHEKLKIVSGIYNNRVISVEEINQLASIPNLEILHSKLTGSLEAPINGLVNILKGNINNLISVINQYAEGLSK